METKVLTNKETHWLIWQLERFVHHIQRELNISKEDAIYKIKREIDIMEMR